MPSRRKREGEPDQTFEGTLAQLEEIVTGIESSEAGLEESIRSYAKGVELLARCREMLKGAELKVEELTRQLQGDRPTESQPEQGGGHRGQSPSTSPADEDPEGED